MIFSFFIQFHHPKSGKKPLKVIGLNFENFKTFLKCKTDSFKWKNQGFLPGKMVSIYKILHIAPHFYECAHAKRPEISIFGKVRRLSMVFPHFLGGKIE